MTMTANVRLYGPLSQQARDTITLDEDHPVDITSTEFVDGRLFVYVDLNHPVDGSSVDLKGTVEEHRAFIAQLTAAVDDAEAAEAQLPDADPEGFR